MSGVDPTILHFGEGENTRLDPAVLKELPQGCKVLSIEPHGISFWATTGRIDVELHDKSTKSYFIKVMNREPGKAMVHGEFESMKEIYKVAPDFVPKPVAWGTYESALNTSFFLCEFRMMTDETRDPVQFAVSLSRLHQNSTSPNGKFGFGTTTYAGNLPQLVEWETSWEKFFAKSLRHALDLEIQAKGQDSELEALIQPLFDKVIPRLLGPLESDGRRVKPSLVHGDLWHANSGIGMEDAKPLIFDACCFYAHNEYEFGQWRPACNGFGAEYISAYNSLVDISPPEEDFEGRLDLYRLRFDTHVSALFTQNEMLRRQVIDVAGDLVKRYGQ